MGDDNAKRKDPSVTLSFKQLVGLAAFILGMIAAFTALLYDGIDKRLDKIEERVNDGLDKHDNRLDDLTERMTTNEVKLDTMMRIKAAENERNHAEAAGDGDGEGVEGAGFGAGDRRSTRRDRHARRAGLDSWVVAEGWSPRSDLYRPLCREDDDCPRYWTCHDRECYPPTSGEGGGSGPPPEPPPENKNYLTAANVDGEYGKYGYGEAAAMVVDFAPQRLSFREKREQRKMERCEKQWRRGCPAPEPIQGSLRQVSDGLADMQLSEASNRLAKLQRHEAKKRG